MQSNVLAIRLSHLVREHWLLKPVGDAEQAQARAARIPARELPKAERQGRLLTSFVLGVAPAVWRIPPQRTYP